MSQITINNVQRKDDGLYECQARNKGGKFFKSGHIQVIKVQEKKVLIKAKNSRIDC